MRLKLSIDCPECVDWMRAQGNELAHIIGACASVGIEHDQSTAEAFEQYMAGVHHNDHQGPRSEPPHRHLHHPLTPQENPS